jgi:hypothetical protein
LNKKSILILFSAIALSACGVNHAFLLNQNLNTTHDQLSYYKFKIVEKVTGSADVENELCNGMSKTRLHENTYVDMLSNSKLMDSSKPLSMW